MELVIEVYELARLLPPYERFELRRQLCRAAVSIPSNIAEGNGRLHIGEYVHHVSIARGSLMELLTELTIAQRLGYLEGETLTSTFERIDHIGRMLTRLAGQLSRRVRRGPSPDGRVPMAASRLSSRDIGS